MAHRAPVDAGPIDFLPTPPWAGRGMLQAMEERGLGPFATATCWEPACGEGHLVGPLAEAFGHVWASDVFEFSSWGRRPPAVQPRVWDARVGPPPELARRIDWVVTNPPFSLAQRFVDVGRRFARQGVAMICRTGWVDGQGRHDQLFRDTPPSLILQFAERVPMHKGRWLPQGSTASHYAAFIWERGAPARTDFAWIRPGGRVSLQRDGDVETWGAPA